MKTNDHRLKILLLSLPLLILFCFNSYPQASPEGSWEGMFMDDYNALLLLEKQEEEAFSGRILMYSNGSQIQDDPLTGIRLEGSVLTFRIEAKQTDFLGRLSEDGSALNGQFIFPDQSEHPINFGRSDVAPKEDSSLTKEFHELHNRIYSQRELDSDLRFLLRQLLKNHPQPYRHAPEASFKTAVSEVEGRIAEGLTLEEFYGLVSRLLEQVGCSHTGARLPGSYRKRLLESGNFFPMELFIKGGRIYFLTGPANPVTGLQPGSEIVGINGMASSEIVERIHAMIPAEGGSLSTKSFEINRDFHTYFQLLDDSDSFEVDYCTNGQTGTFQVISCRYSDLGKLPGDQASGDPVEYQFDETLQTACLRVASFGIRDMEGYLQQLNGIFHELRERKAAQLVLDLRGNRGGHPIFAAQLLSYLVEHPFTYFEPNPEIPDFEPLYHPMQPDELHFGGDLYVLVDGGCLSTAGHLIALLKLHSEAQFVGEEPGSTYSCNDFSLVITLPATGIEVNIPRTSFQVAGAGSAMKDPFPVDHPVETQVNDLLQGKDAPLSYIHELIGTAAHP